MVRCTVHAKRPKPAQPEPVQQFETTSTQYDDLIRVCVRERPLNEKEISLKEEDIIIVDSATSLNIRTKAGLKPLVAHDVIKAYADDEEVYERTALPLIEYIFNGGKAICFAYGQTGSGKTFTMFDQSHGLCIFAAKDVFRLLKDQKYSYLDVYVGFCEIYKKHLHDLLNDRKKVMGLQVRKVDDIETLLGFFDLGNTIRSTGSTGAILQIVLKYKNKFHGKISFVDLAGNDRDLTDVKTRMEGAEINKSLFTLNECMRAFDQDKKHIPFRDSKLTQVLKDYFDNNLRTCIIGTISPNKSNIKQTLKTIKYLKDFIHF